MDVPSEVFIAAKVIGFGVGAWLMTRYLASREKPGPSTDERGSEKPGPGRSRQRRRIENSR